MNFDEEFARISKEIKDALVRLELQRIDYHNQAVANTLLERQTINNEI